MRATRSPLVVLALATLAHGQPTNYYVWPASQAPGAFGVSLTGRVIDLSGGLDLSLAIKEDFVLVGWGEENDDGRQGFLVNNEWQPGTHCFANPSNCVKPPYPMPPLLRASAGYDHALALAKNSLSGPAGRFGLIGWGRNDLGQSTVPDLTAGPWFIEPTAQVADLQRASTSTLCSSTTDRSRPGGTTGTASIRGRP
ncbi:MAG: hypothetical protein JNM80_03800 [Phycisphaerae bacterium]|nr:hypothetical protein [Phycisphaerae bacterium]